jgi:hypothetical protein
MATERFAYLEHALDGAGAAALGDRAERPLTGRAGDEIACDFDVQSERAKPRRGLHWRQKLVADVRYTPPPGRFSQAEVNFG